MKLILIYTIIFVCQITFAQEKGKKIEPWQAWDKYRVQMGDISRQLGVTCIHCHDSRNYRDTSKKTHALAKKHMEMVDMLNGQFKNAFSEKVDCFMCHRGKAVPDYKEKPSKF